MENHVSSLLTWIKALLALLVLGTHSRKMNPDLKGFLEHS